MDKMYIISYFLCRWCGMISFFNLDLVNTRLFNMGFFLCVFVILLPSSFLTAKKLRVSFGHMGHMGSYC